ncbi:helix-turn-helix domain-containing protein [Emticicia sp. CRIBPO]|uniref:helix-turn-helix domain-containing protein n=1 Tax=Emticicia sp. CRIBPO TaxID=2683258 RepID=UPI001412552E|nr:helix-turn-helix domain-containing protein [Emticicia sp. CRIBPO]NBA85541.1 helix-turn-helix domain-containing protein [Emticicia sp. CRIBPO]
MANKILFYRNKLQLTQSELAERSGLSLRTIQRLESGQIPKGYTLKVLAKALETGTGELIEEPESGEAVADLKKIKLINTSALFFMIIPFGNIVIPWIILRRNKLDAVRKTGSEILEIQILWTVITSFFLAVSPLLQWALQLKIPLILIFLFLSSLLNLFIILRNARSLAEKGYLAIRLKNSLL